MLLSEQKQKQTLFPDRLDSVHRGISHTDSRQSAQLDFIRAAIKTSQRRTAKNRRGGSIMHARGSPAFDIIRCGVGNSQSNRSPYPRHCAVLIPGLPAINLHG